ncbi:unnamed protein product [Hapterophycus canaliculatus]
MKHGRTPTGFMALVCALANCCLCGAFLPPPAAMTTATTAWQRRAVSLTSMPRQYCPRLPRERGSSAVRMQQQPGSDQELQVAVSKLAGQVEELTAMVAQLAGEHAGGKSSAKSINGAVLEGVAAVPVAPAKTAKSGTKSGSKPLVSTSAAQQRIEQWLQESGGAASAAAPAAPAAAPVPAPVVAAVAPAVATPPAETAPADDAPVGSGYKVKIEWEGAIHEVTCDAETTLLEAAMDAGLELPSSCMSGSCLTCPGKLVSGSVDQSEGVLEEEQTEAGFLLTCISYPESDVHFAVVDEEDLP